MKRKLKLPRFLGRSLRANNLLDQDVG
jgi:hypothetical protein